MDWMWQRKAELSGEAEEIRVYRQKRANEEAEAERNRQFWEYAAKLHGDDGN
ncbi:hypothetical protein [Streptomyces chartreusis]|uniref:Uncharacterized protein n=1 Tax=Streptomyces chartreusis TaxID=1969 RepID=A0A7H8TBQ8_STRCX|nr:hypothetical protein [Streptomyces chartreusis]QKZ20923.1 hypothetical protein HUT05_28410 [Streptomyces chartreusis]